MLIGGAKPSHLCEAVFHSGNNEHSPDNNVFLTQFWRKLALKLNEKHGF